MILVFGDSITYGAWDKEGGWVQRLRKFLEEKYPKEFFVYNLGIPINETTENILSRIEVELKARTTPGFESENIVIFAIGINDSQFVHSEGRHKVPIDKFKDNIQKLIKIAQKFSSKIIFVGLTPVDERKTTPIPWNTDKSYKNEDIKKYNEIIKMVCNKHGIPFIDLFEDWINDCKNYLDDGLHPNSEGHKRIFETVKNFLVENEYLEV